MGALQTVDNGAIERQELVDQRSADNLTNVQRVGKILSASGYFSDVKDIAQAAVKVMAGQELGIAPVAAVMGIHIIKGKVTLSGNLIAAQVRRHGYNYRHVQFDNTGCVLEFLDKNGAPLGQSSFTEADAKTAGVFTDMYRKFPRNMYFNRAMSNGAKWYCPEVTCGLPVYVPEELGAHVDGEGQLVQEGRGSKEAAQAVAKQKIGELKGEGDFRHMPFVSEPGEESISESLLDPPSEMEQQLQASVDQANAETAKSIDFGRMMEGFGAIKEELTKLGAQDEYYRILKSHGFDKSNQIRPLKKARDIYREMSNSMIQIRGLNITQDDADTIIEGRQ